MFTQRDKIKELAEYLVKNENTQCLIFKNTKYGQKDCAEVLTCEYTTPKYLKIVYNEWFVEGFELAKKMQLPGTERHGTLVKGSGVVVSTMRTGDSYTFYGKDALSIKNACESNRDIESLILSNTNQIIR